MQLNAILNKIGFEIYSFGQLFDSEERGMGFMSGSAVRTDVIFRTLKAQHETQQPLLMKINSALNPGVPPYLPVERFNDDFGSYYWIPKLVTAFNLKYPGRVAAHFYLFISLIASIVLFLGLRRICKGIHWLFIFSLALGTFFFSLFFLDVYIANYAGVAMIPLAFWFSKDIVKTKKWGLIFIVSLGLIIVSGFLESVRSLSTVPFWIFLATFFTLKIPGWKGLMASLGLVIATLLLSIGVRIAFFYPIQARRDLWLSTQNWPTSSGLLASHAIWHNAYIGLGFLKGNPYGIVAGDSSGWRRAKEIQPTLSYFWFARGYALTDSTYEKTIKTEFFKILLESPWFVTKTFILKLVEALRRGLVFSIIGWICCYRFFLKRRLSVLEVFPFAAAGAFTLAPAVWFLPNDSYLLGYYLICIVFTVFALSQWKEERRA